MACQSSEIDYARDVVATVSFCKSWCERRVSGNAGTSYWEEPTRGSVADGYKVRSRLAEMGEVPDDSIYESDSCQVQRREVWICNDE